MNERLIPRARPDDDTLGSDKLSSEDVLRKESVLRDLSEKAPQLVSVVEKLKFRNYEEFEFDGVGFLPILTKPTQADLKDPKAHVNSQSPAVFHASTAIDGYDIYIIRSLSRGEKRRMVFHEAFEASLLARGFDEDEAHAPTLIEEEKHFGKR